MIYKAIVEEIINVNEARIRIPLVHRTKNSIEHTPTSQLPVATTCAMAGCYSAMQLGDIVIVGLENSDLEKPIILGHLSGVAAADTYSEIGATIINVTGEANLPNNTSVGNLTPEELQQLSGVTNNIQQQLNHLLERIEQLEANR